MKNPKDSLRDKARLAFELLEKEFEVMTFDETFEILGGTGTTFTEDPDMLTTTTTAGPGSGGNQSLGNEWGNFNGFGGPDNPIQLQEVSVSSGTSGYWGNLGGLGYPSNPINLTEVTSSNGGGFSGYDAVGLMMSSMGMAADHADVAAAVMKLETKGFSIASRSFAAFGILSNAYEFIQDPNWTDGLQVAGGAALLVPGLNGAVVIGGGVALAGWELYELIND